MNATLRPFGANDPAFPFVKQDLMSYTFSDGLKVPPGSNQSLSDIAEALIAERLDDPTFGFYTFSTEPGNVGYIGLAEREANYGKEGIKTFFEVMGIYIADEHRGKRYGTLLLNCAVKFAKTKRKDFIVGWPHNANAHSIRVFRDAGFTFQTYNDEPDRVIALFRLT